jgi:hypothetical protein
MERGKYGLLNFPVAETSHGLPNKKKYTLGSWLELGGGGEYGRLPLAEHVLFTEA